MITEFFNTTSILFYNVFSKSFCLEDTDSESIESEEIQKSRLLPTTLTNKHLQAARSRSKERVRASSFENQDIELQGMSFYFTVERNSFDSADRVILAQNYFFRQAIFIEK